MFPAFSPPFLFMETTNCQTNRQNGCKDGHYQARENGLRYVGYPIWHKGPYCFYPKIGQSPSPARLSPPSAVRLSSGVPQ